MSGTDGAHQIDPTRATCSGARFVGVRPIAPPDRDRLQHRIGRFRRSQLTDQLALPLAVVLALVGATLFAVAAPDGEGEPPPALLVLVCFAVVLVLGLGALSTIAGLIFPSSMTEAIAYRGSLGAALSMGLLADYIRLEFIAATAGVIGLWFCGAGGMRMLSNWIYAIPARRFDDATADLVRGETWRFEARVSYDDAEEERSSSSTADAPESVAFDVLPLSCVDVADGGLQPTSLRPRADEVRPAASAQDSRELLANERVELEQRIREHVRARELWTLLALWVFACVGVIATVHVIDLGTLAIPLAFAFTLATIYAAQRGRFAMVAALRRDLASGVVLVDASIATRDGERRCELLPSSREMWTYR